MPALPVDLAAGPFPADDGWGWLYRRFDRLAPQGSRARRVLCGWFRPWGIERWRAGRLPRLLGVPRFGRFIPTGGVAVRRATGAAMAPYTLSGTSLRAAREFYYRACVFEALHLPFLVVLLVLAAHRLAQGRADLAVEDTVVNLVFNVYPILHHRHTRARIVELLARRARRTREGRGCPATVEAGAPSRRVHGSESTPEEEAPCDRSR